MDAARAALEAKVLTAEAVENARRARYAASRAADDLVADRARQDAVAVRFRAEAAATRVLIAADVAAAVAMQAEDDPQGDGARQRAASIVATARTTALNLAREEALIAVAVQQVVLTRADLLAASRSAVDLVIDDEAAAAAVALDAQVELAAARARELAGW